MFKVTRKIISVVLVVALMLSSVGVSVFADSINNDQSTTATTVNESTVENLLGEKSNDENTIVNEEIKPSEEEQEDKEEIEEKEESSESIEETSESIEETSESTEESEGTSEESTEETSEESTEETSEESTEETSEEIKESTNEESVETTAKEDAESTNEESSEETSENAIENTTTITELAHQSETKIEDEEKTNEIVATTSEADENNNLLGLENVENDKTATDSDAEFMNEEGEFIKKPSLSLTPMSGTNDTLFGSLIDIPDNKKVDLRGNWWLNFGLSGIPKETIKKIEFDKGININNRDWDIIEVVDDGSGGRNYKLFAKTNIANDYWSWRGDNCRGIYPYPPYDEGSFHHDGATPYKQFNTYYNTFSQYYKDNMVLMHESEHWWGKGTAPAMREFDAYLRLPIPDEVEAFEGNYAKLANGTEWWILEHIHRSDGYIGGEGAAVFPADGNYDERHGGDAYTNYKIYREQAGFRPVMTMKKDGLKLDPSRYNYKMPYGICSDITNTSGDLLGFAYVIDNSGEKTLHIHMLYDDAIKATDATNIFKGFTNVTEIKGLDMVDFSNCTNMTSMFEDCSALTGMSYYDSTINKLPDSFGSVTTNINSMFKGCESLSNLNFLPDAFAPNAVTMEATFEDTKLLSLPSCITTTNVTNMKRLFARNNNQIFDFNNMIPAFVASGIDVSEMFADSENLFAITVDTNYVGLPANVTKSTDMFKGCINLAGGEGFRYKEIMCDGKYARVDYGATVPGYFACTDVDIYNSVEITLESDWKTNAPKITAKRIVFTTENSLLADTDDGFEMPVKINGTAATGKGWTIDDGETILIHISYKIGGFKTSPDWTGFFEGFTNVESFVGLDLIDTSDVTNMEAAFKNCAKLDTFNLDDLDITSVTSIESMFEGCKEFRGFSSATQVFASLQNASNAFKGCTSLRLIGFDMFLSATLQNTTSMFENCTSLRSIMVDNNLLNFPAHVIESTDMFKNCTNIVGGQGTTYNKRINPTGANFANVDYGGIKPGYFTLRDSSKYAEMSITLPTDFYDYLASYMKNKSTVTGIKFVRNKKGMNDYGTSYHMSDDGIRLYINDNQVTIHCGTFTPKIKFPANSTGLFKDFTGVTYIEGLENVDISDVTNMSEMFSGCTNLEELNLLSFATNKVTNVSEMFKDDTHLKIIKASSSFAIRGVTGTDMFLNCSQLAGGEGTTYNDANVDSSYAFPDEGLTNPGYFTWDDGITLVYNLIYDGNGADGGTAMPKEEGRKENESFELAANTYTKTHHRFLGWSELEGATSEDWKTHAYWSDQDTFSYEPTEQFTDKIIYAVWEKIDYTVVYDANGASGGTVPLSQTGYSGDDLTLRTNPGNLWKTGRYIIGWDENQGATNPTYTLGGTMNKTFTSPGIVTLYAIWGNVPYTIRLNPNGATGEKIDIPAQSDVAVNLPNNRWTRRDYTFLGWNTENNATATNWTVIGEHYNPKGGVVNRTIGANQANSVYNLYAVWKENDKPTPTPTPPSGGGGSSGGGGDTSLVGPITIIPTTYIPGVKTILGTFDDTQVKWNYDPTTNKYKLTVNINGQNIPVSNGFYVINETQNVNNAAARSPMPNTYYFNERGEMLTGWLITTDSKKYLASVEKNINEGQLIAGWKVIDGSWYFFDFEGALLINSITPDGYRVGFDGKWEK